MRTHDNGCFFSVSVSKAEVETFAERWPCFGPHAALWFQFDKSNGDLVDLEGNNADMDGYGVAALADDAKAFGAQKLKLDL